MTTPGALAARWEERVFRGAHPVAYPALRLARRPVQRVPGVGVVVTDATLMREVLMNSAGFSKGASSDLWTPVFGSSLLLNMDGADHVTLRRRLGPLFTPAAVERLAAASIDAPVANLRSRLLAGERVDIVAEVRAFASVAMSQLVGLPVSALNNDLFERVSRITGFVSLSRGRFTPSQLATARSVFGELTASALDAYREGGDHTVPGRMRELGLTEDEAMGAVGAFVVVGTETLSSYLPRLTAVLVDSGWFARIAADRSLVDAAVAEGLRVTTPSPVMLRIATTDAAIGSTPVLAGDRVVLATFAANRALGRFDPEANAAASLKNLWFGAGSHYCIGAPLAMAQIRRVVDALLDAGDIRVVSRRVSRRVMIPSYASLEVERS